MPGDGARPCYADYDLRITYNQPYVEAMYKKAGGFLVAELFTSSGQRVEPEVVRSRTVLPALTAETAVLFDQLQNADCIVVDLDTIAGYDETTYRTRLATDTAYEVADQRRRAAEPVYRWTFVTSRYRTFAAHLADLRAVPWHERLPASVDFAAVAAQLGPFADRGAEDEAWRAIWQGQLGYPIRTLPERPEVDDVLDRAGGFRGAAPVVRQPRAALRLRPHGAGAQAPRDPVRPHAVRAGARSCRGATCRTVSCARSTARVRCSCRSTPPVSRCGCPPAAIARTSSTG